MWVSTKESILDAFRATGGYSKDLQFLPCMLEECNMI